MRTRSAVRPLVICLTSALAITACKSNADSTAAGTVASDSVVTPSPSAPVYVRGTVVSTSATDLVIKGDSGTVTVKVAQPFHVYTRVPGDLAHVKESSFIGVTTVKQADGLERATEIHIFPEELRGLGEGSRMMAPDTTNVASRMTNGKVTASRMTNGAVAGARMSNGNVNSISGSTMTVAYAGGSQTVTVPPGTPVTEFASVTSTVAVGDRLTVVAKRGADGMLTSDKALKTNK